MGRIIQICRLWWGPFSLSWNRGSNRGTNKLITIFLLFSDGQNNPALQAVMGTIQSQLEQGLKQGDKRVFNAYLNLHVSNYYLFFKEITNKSISHCLVPVHLFVYLLVTFLEVTLYHQRRCDPQTVYCLVVYVCKVFSWSNRILIHHVCNTHFPWLWRQKFDSCKSFNYKRFIP